MSREPARADSDGDRLLIGVVGRTHGIKGSVVVNPETDFPADRFHAGAVLFVGPLDDPAAGVPREVVEARFQSGRPVIRFAGIESMTDAEALAGLALRVPVTAVAPLPEGTYYRHDLVGCQVVDATGAVVGTVKAVEGTLDRSYLIVPRQGGDAMIPLVDGICVRVDVAARRVVIDPPEGLLDL